MMGLMLTLRRKTPSKMKAPAAPSRQQFAQAAFGALFVLVILFHVVFLASPDHHRATAWSRRGMQQLHSSALYKLLQTAATRAAERSANLTRPSKLQLDPVCQLPETQLQGVLAAAQAASASFGAPGTFISGDRARAAALNLRAKLQQEWAVALAPYASKQASAAARRCKSVGLLQRGALGNRTSDRTALLLVMDSWQAFDHLMQLYAINLVSIWAYARLHGYGLELYVQGEPPLPQHMPVYFVKVTGVRHLFDTLGYQHVLYLDFDTFTSPHSAPPLALLYGEFPAASLLMQAEHNMCAAAMLWRNTPDADMLLQAWWDVGASGCCPTFPHDQTALKHMLLMYVANVTGQPWLYPYSMRRRFKLPATPPAAAATATAAAALTGPAAAPPAQQVRSQQQHAPPQTQQQQQQQKQQVLSRDHMPHKVSTWAKLRPLLQERRSAFGLVGIDVQAPSMLGTAHSMHGPSHNRAVLHNCLGMWWGCVPINTPSVLYHTGHWGMEDLKYPWVAERLLHSIQDWLSTLDTCALNSTAGA